MAQKKPIPPDVIAAAYVELTVAIVHLEERITDLHHDLRRLQLHLTRPDFAPHRRTRTGRTRMNP